MIFPNAASYSGDLLRRKEDGALQISHRAPGADRFKYSLNWGTTYSDWEDYTGADTTLPPKVWSGTDRQAWDGEHVIVQYWSRIAGSSSHAQHGDLARDDKPPRRFPHMFIHGPFNQYGFDAGLADEMRQNQSGIWQFDFMTEWPAQFQFNVWGLNPDGQPDKTGVFGDINNDTIIDRIPPISLLDNVVNVTETPPSPFLAYRIILDDGTYRLALIPVGSRWRQLALFLLLGLVPALSGAAGTWIFVQSFYRVRFNQIGIQERRGLIPQALRRKLQYYRLESGSKWSLRGLKPSAEKPSDMALAMDAGSHNRRTVLIATMEYDIEDWAIKIKIGGLGVMAQLMGKNLGHQDLVWVVPCVGGVDYPVDTPAEPMLIKILDKEYLVQVQYHILRNITYVLLDAPVFRQQSQSEPYPARMDDLESAIYYSAWNSCIAEAIKRFRVDLYHINDYHGTVAPLHLLPRTIPCVLSLHNAEFQGLWSMRKQSEREEVCRVFNVDAAIAQRYVQFGEVFNLLHAGASYLRVHQGGFGAVGVSKKYGKRSFARYPIFWGLKEIGALPNPDPSDTAEWNNETPAQDVRVDADFEAGRGELRRRSQEWAGLDQNPTADLFVFVGRWSMQKGVDLIADVFPSVLESNPQVQLICIGPVIDLYGKFAAYKLEKMMELYPGRVFSRPEFTSLPPYIFSGAEFALIPSRDEPFGLVAVEFGRKGALGVGSRVGGLGQMPGWWFTIESTTTKHLILQFKTAIHDALASKPEVRAIMRARSSMQRFPVAQWVQDLDKLQSTAIKVHEKHVAKHANGSSMVASESRSVNAADGLMVPGLATGPSSEVVVAPEHTTENEDTYRWPVRQHHGNSLTPGHTHPSTPHLISSLSPGQSPWTSYPGTPLSEGPPLISPLGNSPWLNQQAGSSLLSLVSVVGDKKDFNLQRVDPFFTDANGEYARAFKSKLEALDGKTSEDDLCIEELLIKYEKKFFNRFHDAKLGISRQASWASSVFRMHRSSPEPSIDGDDVLSQSRPSEDEFWLATDYVPPSGLRKILQRRIGDWPLYTILLGIVSLFYSPSIQDGREAWKLTRPRAKSSRQTHTRSLCSQARSAKLRQSSTSSPASTC